MDIHEKWQREAELWLLAERNQAAATPLLELSLPALPGRHLIFKDESAHPSGSLKHRLARSLLLQGLRNGAIKEGTPLFDASSGNTAVSEAWFASRLGLRYFAVVPDTTSPGKQELIRDYGGECITVSGGQCCKTEAALLASEQDGYFLDQFTNAARATNWQKHNVITELFSQLQEQEMPVPDWFVMGAGTGGTTTCAGRYFEGYDISTRLMVVDPEDSAFFNYYQCNVYPGGCLCASRVEGIGRPSVEPSFTAALVDRMSVIPDAASYAAARWLRGKLGKAVGMSTGCNLIGAIELLDQNRGTQIATLICDEGSRYAGTLDNSDWLAQQGLQLEPWLQALDNWYSSGQWMPPSQSHSTVRKYTGSAIA